MGKRGPKPVALRDLYRTACVLYDDFKKLAGLQKREWFNDKLYHSLKTSLKPVALSDEELAKFREREEMILNGRLSQVEREKKLRDLQQGIEGMEVLSFLRTCDVAYDLSMMQTQEPGNPDALRELLAARTPERVREICETHFSRDSIETMIETIGIDPLMMLIEPGMGSDVVKRRVRKRPKVLNGDFSQTLHYYADRFIAAKNHRKFPRGRTRKSTLLEQLWFLSRALAGAIDGRQIGTVLNLLSSKRPDQTTRRLR